MKQNSHLIENINLEQILNLNNRANYLINNKDQHMIRNKPRYNDEEFATKHINNRFGRHLLESDSPTIRGSRLFNQKKGSVEPTSMKTKLVSMLNSRRQSQHTSKVRLPSIDEPI